MDRREKGLLGENRAEAYFKEQGYEILERNYRLRTGEIDLIATKDDFFVFIEVKFRNTNDFGRPAEAVGKGKQEKIAKTALHYLKNKGGFDKMIRFDVLEVWPEELRHIPNAFEYYGKYGY